jgi:hypothetical protein
LLGYRRDQTAPYRIFVRTGDSKAEFCALAEAHEEGSIEAEPAYFEESRLIPGIRVVGAGAAIEREQTSVQEGFDLAQTSFPTVNGLGCARVLRPTRPTPLRSDGNY